MNASELQALCHLTAQTVNTLSTTIHHRGHMQVLAEIKSRSTSFSKEKILL